MAEIKSTMELVMERLAQMDAAASEGGDSFDSEEKVKQGMRLAADFMKNEVDSLAKAIDEQPPTDQQYFRQGVVQTLLRNIVLPRYDDNTAQNQAIAGLMDLSGEAGDMGQVVGEMKQILDKYVSHHKDLRNQLEESFRQQMEQAMAQQTDQAGVGMKVNPATHPKFAEEWLRLQGELKDQYGRAIDQYKNLIAQRLGAS